MAVESRPGSLSGMSDDRLGTVAVALVVAELQLTPDVSPQVMDRISRDVLAYPEQFDRRQAQPESAAAPLPSERSTMRTLVRLAVLGVIIAIILALVIFAASASAATGDLEWAETSCAAHEAVSLYAVDQGGCTLHVVTEAS